MEVTGIWMILGDLVTAPGIICSLEFPGDQIHLMVGEKCKENALPSMALEQHATMINSSVTKSWCSKVLMPVQISCLCIRFLAHPVAGFSQASIAISRWQADPPWNVASSQWVKMLSCWMIEGSWCQAYMHTWNLKCTFDHLYIDADGSGCMMPVIFWMSRSNRWCTYCIRFI